MTSAGPETSDVTIVVITRDRWPDLQRSLPRHRVPVILLDNGSVDGTPARVREAFPAVDVVEVGQNLGAVARNHGVERACTPYVAFADDDSWWHPGALALAAAALDAHPRLAVLAARVLIGEDGRPDPICAAMGRSPLGRARDLPGPSVLGFLACGVVVRRDAFLAAGGFDDVVFFGGEEERLALDLASAGWGLAYVDDVVAHHDPSERRDGGDQRARAERNRVLTAVMRRPWNVVARTAWPSRYARSPWSPRDAPRHSRPAPRAAREAPPAPGGRDGTTTPRERAPENAPKPPTSGV